MAMKSVLVPVEDNEGMQATLQTALAFGRRFGSCMEAVATLPLIDNYIVGEMVPLWPPAQTGTADSSRDALMLFERFMEENGVQRRERAPEGPSWTVRDGALLGDSAVAAHARVFDITVVGRPGAGAAGPRLSLLEAVLFESGRPILMAPPGGPPERGAIGETVLIAWNCSTETARAVSMAMPILVQARRIRILTVEGATVPGPSGDELVRRLRLDGVEADAVTVQPGGRSQGEATLDHAASFGADLIIKGAYTQSRLRQMIFGGVTSHILSASTVPVLFAH
ncbi:universal stress protein UspA [Alsobacter metallidurans]|uniref:Universal stress protein UspA n=1 Tax=Alsobacter metallidurans TaxID=340221 RepID=A0A917ICJ4_9HYPH|nr:universal stress protein [Alsobacter metallidurans]GGH32789.1 universal stress protein UspA [Alsobacter metallidurans]